LKCEREGVVRLWHGRALPNLRPRRLRWWLTAFDEVWDLVRPRGPGEPEVPAGEKWGAAVRAAAAAPVPPGAARHPPRLQKLAKLCRALHDLRGGRDFFLSARTAAEYLRVSTMTAWRDLRRLVADGLLRVAEPGKPGGVAATTWRYCGTG
jgi:hypothetical protein